MITLYLSLAWCQYVEKNAFLSALTTAYIFFLGPSNHKTPNRPLQVMKDTREDEQERNR